MATGADTRGSPGWGRAAKDQRAEEKGGHGQKKRVPEGKSNPRVVKRNRPAERDPEGI